MKRITAILFSFTLTTASVAQKNQLDYYINQAIASSPLLKDYRNQAAATAYDSILILLGYKPQFAANGLGTYAPVVNGWGYDEVITNGQNVNALFGVSQQIPN